MKSNQLSACFYPTQVILVDDDQRFLEKALKSFSSEKILTKGCGNAQDCLSHLSDQHKVSPFVRRCVNWLDEEFINHRTVDVNIKIIYEEIYNIKRFEEVSVVVSDYAMPSMNGLELFQQIKHLPVKKILLTGEADLETAIKAFNKGLIDKFIRKDEPEFFDIVLNTIREFQQDYFAEQSELILNTITRDPSRPSCLDDPIFIELFKKMVHKNNITEYYLLDEFGSFLLLDDKANPSFFVVKDENAMNYYLQLAKECEETPKKIITAIESRKQIPFLFNEEDFEASPANWDQLLHPCKSIRGRNIYYYALVTKSKHYRCPLLP